MLFTLGPAASDSKLVRNLPRLVIGGWSQLRDVNKMSVGVKCSGLAGAGAGAGVWRR